ncbi:hypothetical protein [Bradyrhizobium sp. Arg816]|uniref:hypothetical protein n=1 Tax=Bradyrhizobium sp. Arg816 TaxID=2998491 RepID=UPI00249DCB52|nr:hypothetical protein [Bradyrhizobium sp. Arg816]MDI3561744.1 hypothetical protein [Bradyrhizobium sp. Arg816]
MAVLDDENPLVRAQGWSFLGWLGTLSNPNPLHTETFKRVVREDGKPLAHRADGLLSRLRDKNLSPDEARAASSEFEALRNAALGVPEIAALLVTSARLDQSVPASDLDQIKQASARVRQASRPPLLRSASAKETEALIATLASRSPNDRDSRLDSANTVATVQLTAAQADALEPLARDTSADIDLRRLLVLALIRNNRASAALSFVDEQLLRPNVTSEAGTYALETLTELAFVDPIAARKAISDRAQLLLPFLTDFEHFTNASAVLSRLSGDEIAKQTSHALTKRIELGLGLVGSACAYAVSLPRSPGIPVGLALFGGTEKTRPDPANTAACVLLLDPNTPASKHLRDLLVGRQSESRDDRYAHFVYLDALWSRSSDLDASAFPNTVANLRKSLVSSAANLLDAVPLFSFAGVDAISAWAARAEPLGLSAQFSRHYWTRWAITRIPGIASALVVWLAALVALVLMSRSANIRAFLLFHPFGRQLGLFGQVNTFIFAAPYLRRLFFRPYRSTMLGVLGQQDVSDYDEKAYFVGSGATPIQRGGIAAQIRELDRQTVSQDSSPSASVVVALRAWKGRVVLVGPSGRGKTMFLRHHILWAGGIREPAIFATASSLRGDLRKAMLGRLSGAITDEGFLDSLVASGKLDVYIDGLNEVDAEARSAITDYVTARPGANIFLTTQPLERYPGDAALFFLLPLTRTQVVEFLLTRGSNLPEGAKIRGDSFVAQAKAFVAERLAEADAQAATPEDSTGVERARALIDRLSNPMDLQTVAELLALGQRPDIWGLQKQRHRLVEKRYQDRTNGERFPLNAFSRSVYEARRDARTEVDEVRFPRIAEILLEEKQIQRYVSNDSSFKSDGYIFRHDKIRDFYTYKAFVVDPTLRVTHADDDKFSGVYDLLTVELPANEAIALREFLLESALDRSDHRLSDRYLEGMRARRFLESKDPDWLPQYDRPDVAAENVTISRNETLRAGLLDETARAVARLDAGRSGTRVLSSALSDALLEAAVALLQEAGFSRGELIAGQRTLIYHSDWSSFGLLTIATPTSLTLSLIHATKANLDALPIDSEPTLLLINAEADLPPSDRSSQAIELARSEITRPNVVIFTALDLLTRVRQGFPDDGPLANTWRRK